MSPASGLGKLDGSLVAGKEESQAALVADWRELKLEREVWRSLDFLLLNTVSLVKRHRYYTDFFEPSFMTSKVSTWLPNHLLPG